MTVEGVRDRIRSLTQDFGPIFCLAIWSGVVLECPVVGRRIRKRKIGESSKQLLRFGIRVTQRVVSRLRRVRIATEDWEQTRFMPETRVAPGGRPAL